MPTTWTQVTSSSVSWTDATRGASISHLKGSPLGLLLALTYHADGDETWSISSDPSTTWTLVS